MLIAITREVSPSLAACELSFVDRAPIDVARADAQHRDYQRALSKLRCEVMVLPALPEYPGNYTWPRVARHLCAYF